MNKRIAKKIIENKDGLNYNERQTERARQRLKAKREAKREEPKQKQNEKIIVATE